MAVTLSGSVTFTAVQTGTHDNGTPRFDDVQALTMALSSGTGTGRQPSPLRGGRHTWRRAAPSALEPAEGHRRDEVLLRDEEEGNEWHRRDDIRGTARASVGDRVHPAGRAAELGGDPREVGRRGHGPLPAELGIPAVGRSATWTDCQSRPYHGAWLSRAVAATTGAERGPAAVAVCGTASMTV